MGQMACDARPIFLSPAFKDYIWGGERLRREYAKQTDMNPLAESWELSCHEAGLSVIENGAHAGWTLRDYLRAYPQHMGADAPTEFPLLIKLIDAEANLSIQVHPDDDYARRMEHANGKMEMWYVVDAKPGAGIYYGFKDTVTRERMAAAIEEKTLPSLLNWVEAKAGDFFFIPAGTVHAIGAGLLIAEVQQSSDVTYRLWDYNRVGADGKPRTLHIAQALDVSMRAPRAATQPYAPDCVLTGCRIRHLVKDAHFTVDVLHLDGAMEAIVGTESFVSLLCFDGAGAILQGGERMMVPKGQSVFLPAGMGEYQLEGRMTLLKTTL